MLTYLPLCSIRVSMHSLVLFHLFIVKSLEPLTIVLSFSSSSESTEFSCPSNVVTHLPVSLFQILMVLSLEALHRFPSDSSITVQM